LPRYEIVHTTEYRYSVSVPVSQHVARLSPRPLPQQQCLHHELQIEPAPAVTASHTDYFGNPTTYFAIQGAHRRLSVRSRSIVSLTPEPPARLSDSPPWESVRDRSVLPLEAIECAFESVPVPSADELAAYARPSFVAGRPLLGAVADLTRRIHGDFAFDRTATTVSTPLATVFKLRRGVCQDFADRKSVV